MLTKEEVAILRLRYPEGSRLVLDFMGDEPCPLPAGSVGIVTEVDNEGAIHCEFRCGRNIRILPEVDRFHRAGLWI